MKRKLAAVATLATLGAAPAGAEAIHISTNGSNPATLGAQEYFVGHVVVNALFPATEFTHGTGGQVTFAPGARTAWHTHPAGQTLIVTSGTGWVEEEGKDRTEIKPGDVVWIPAGVKHWHGATETSGMTHIAISYMLDGKNVDWMEQVTPEQYRVSE
ncbi:cupin domain-containing protein [Mesorhizobium waimense]|uniref:Cupin domain-containing protein n=1 Tax=Mesorhizobium waimense TaxID=1300307 RepID=A0A3A5KH32_9HYPH|nr:cupin domain-containing protein [Mesorhizobium waimense]RJT31995.1 cupin domain-containing protein [Mesorhizobium waimense]